MTITATKFTLQDSSHDPDFSPLVITLEENNNRLEINLPDGQILALEQFLGETRLIHWTNPDDDTIESTIIPLITPHV